MRRHLIDLRAPALRPVPGPQCDGVLVVFAGLAGTGKTTLSRRLAADLSAAVVRVDAIEAAIVRNGELKPPLGPVGYVVAQEVVAGCLAVGTAVVVDAVSLVTEAHAG